MFSCSSVSTEDLSLRMRFVCQIMRLPTMYFKSWFARRGVVIFVANRLLRRSVIAV